MILHTMNIPLRHYNIFTFTIQLHNVINKKGTFLSKSHPLFAITNIMQYQLNKPPMIRGETSLTTRTNTSLMATQTQ